MLTLPGSLSSAFSNPPAQLQGLAWPELTSAPKTFLVILLRVVCCRSYSALPSTSSLDAEAFSGCLCCLTHENGAQGVVLEAPGKIQDAQLNLNFRYI